MTASVEQVTDWINHPETYDIQTDEDFAWFVAWTELTYEMNDCDDVVAREVHEGELNAAKGVHS